MVSFPPAGLPLALSGLALAAALGSGDTGRRGTRGILIIKYKIY